MSATDEMIRDNLGESLVTLLAYAHAGVVPPAHHIGKANKALEAWEDQFPPDVT
jgi:hypothetical protein